MRPRPHGRQHLAVAAAFLDAPVTNRADPLQLEETAGPDPVEGRRRLISFIRGYEHGRRSTRSRLVAVALLAFAAGWLVNDVFAAPRPSQDLVPATTGAPSERAVLPRTSLSASPTPPAMTTAPRTELAPILTSAPLEGLTRSGIIAWADESLGPAYLAVPVGPGHRIRICSVGGCLTLTSTDAGPNRAMLREGRVADLAVGLWERIAGVDRSRGLIQGTWTVVP